jgi:tetratricopeptide (TPR) repeat protein
VLLAAVIAAYLCLVGRALTYEFVWDDVGEIANAPLFDEPLLVGLRATQTERTDPTVTQLAGATLLYDSWRPLLFATYWAEIHTFGRTPGPMHATNIVLGMLAILLAFALARQWLPASWAIVVAAVVGLHPVQIEAVAYISGRGDLLASVLVLAAALAAVRGRPVLAAVAFAGSLLAKEACIGLPIVALVWARRDRTRWPTVGALAGVAIAYLVVRRVIVTATAGTALADAIIQLPAVWLEYVRIALAPFDLSIERAHDARYVWPGLVAIALVAWRARHLGLVWFAVLLAPAATAIASSHVAADRYLHAPMFGLAMAAVAGVRALTPAVRRIVLGVAAVWAALLLVVGWRQVPVWHDNAALYAHALAMAPDSSDAHFKLAYLAARRDDWATAIPLLRRAIELDPSNPRALDNLGVGLLRTGHPAEAEIMLARAVAADPAAFRAWSNLGLARLQLGKRAEGCAAIERALQINPRYAPALQARCR